MQTNLSGKQLRARKPVPVSLCMFSWVIIALSLVSVTEKARQVCALCSFSGQSLREREVMFSSLNIITMLKTGQSFMDDAGIELSTGVHFALALVLKPNWNTSPSLYTCFEKVCMLHSILRRQFCKNYTTSVVTEVLLCEFCTAVVLNLRHPIPNICFLYHQYNL